MSDLIDLRESSAVTNNGDNGSIPLHEQFTPLSERAIRSDGTVGLRLIGPGWGTSGYYGRDVLERDIPRIFPAGTQMFWNHPTPTEEMERPEGDLRNLAAVIVSDPVWMDAGPAGPGMYAESRPFTGYAQTIDEIGEHIGVSIRGLGRYAIGTAEGREGKIVQEIAAGKSIDFVTAPGAGGAVIKIFESAPGAAPLPAPGSSPEGGGRLGLHETVATIEQFLAEAGRVLSGANEKKLRAAMEQIMAVLSMMDPASESARKLAEARNIGEWLESRLHLSLTTIADEMYGDGRVSREERKSMSSAIGAALDAYRTDLLANAGQLFQRDTWANAPDSADIAMMNGEMMNESEDNAMSEQELKEAQDALAEAQAAIAEREASLAAVRELLLMREAADFVSGLLATAELPDVTKARLQKQLSANPPVKEGKLDTAVYETTVETVVTEAQAEIAAIGGRDGRVTGNGAGSPAGNEPTIEAARARLNKSLAGMGYGGRDGN
jgi:hypothetical protein